MRTKESLLISPIVLYAYKKQSKQKASLGKLHNAQGTARRLPTKTQPHQTPRRTATACPPTKPPRGICQPTLGGRLQAPGGARTPLLLATGPRQRASSGCRSPQRHRRRRPAAKLTTKSVLSCNSWPWSECGSRRSAGKVSTVAHCQHLVALRRLFTFSSGCFCNNQQQRCIKHFTAVRSSHQPLQSVPN